MESDPTISQELLENLLHGREEVYLEYKGDVSWNSIPKRNEIVKTIFSMANERDGGVIIVGVKDNGQLLGLSDKNYESYNHDQINQFVNSKSNQQIQCKVLRSNITDPSDGNVKGFVFIQVTESREFPCIYVGQLCLNSDDAGYFLENIGLRTGALYIRNKSEVGNKEIITLNEWQELIERTHKKYKRETLRRYEIIKNDEPNLFEKEIEI